MYREGPANTEALLESEVERFRSMYPHSRARFARIVGRRVSHIAGATRELHIGERRVPVNSSIVMFVAAGDRIPDRDLARFATQVASALSDDRGRTT